MLQISWRFHLKIILKIYFHKPMDYTIFYKSNYEGGNIDCGTGYDFLFSGYDDCERTKTIFEKIKYFNFLFFEILKICILKKLI